MVLIDLFCAIDDFCQEFEPRWNQLLLTNGVKQRHRPGSLSLSEILTIIVWVYHSGYRTFKDFYTKKILIHHQPEFPQFVSYSRFVELMAEVGVPLTCFLNTRKGHMAGIAFIDSTSITVCYNRRIASNKVLQVSPNVERPVWVGFTASNSIWW